jgi:ABC-type glycerol-3-phosphate transport system substrate-binding protein
MLMMLQGGTKMNDEKQKNRAAFNSSSTGASSPGQNALNFYTQFSQANSEVYTWNSRMDYSVDSFRYGRTAMMLNYSYWAQRLKEMDPKLNFYVAPAPQLELDKKVNYGIYWGLGVAKNKTIPADAEYTDKDRIEQAWNYITFVTTKPAIGSTFDPTKTYLEETRKPAARRDLIQEQKDQPILGVFAEQALTAKTWIQLEDNATEEIFSNMIDEVISGKSNPYEAITTAESRFDNLIK